MVDYKKMLECAKVVLDFADNVPGGDSYWIDDEGKLHSADMGYACGFLSDLVQYAERKQNRNTPGH